MNVRLVDDVMADRILIWALNKFEWDQEDWWCAYNRYFDVNVWLVDDNTWRVALYEWDQDSNSVKTSQWQSLGEITINK